MSPKRNFNKFKNIIEKFEDSTSKVWSSIIVSILGMLVSASTSFFAIKDKILTEQDLSQIANGIKRTSLAIIIGSFFAYIVGYYFGRVKSKKESINKVSKTFIHCLENSKLNPRHNEERN